MSLRKYKRKRNFRRTPEPAGRVAASGGARQFVVQKHDASRLHYDFRLELDGTLKSWAVPKGPSLDPGVKALAVQVEDHPLDYAGFEGVIPKGEYGGGTVMVWDRGTWEPEVDPERGLRDGKLKFSLHGEKLHGRWALVRMSGRAGEDGRNWLLIKHDDDAARSMRTYDVAKREPLSVLSGRDLPEVAAAANRVGSSNGHGGKRGGFQKSHKPKKNGKATARSAKSRRKTPDFDFAALPGAREARQPAKLKPQLATLAAIVPSGDGWLNELKFDGYRILAFKTGEKVRLVSRNGKDWSHRFPTIATAVGELPIERAIFDGEVVALNDDRVSDFQKLQNMLKRGDESAQVYYIFDWPHAGGFNLTAVPLADRKAPLGELLLAVNPRNDGPLRYSDHIVGQSGDVLDRACQSGMEGIIAKQADAPYEQARTRSWLKVKCRRRQEFVVGGFTKPSGSRVGLGALLLGYFDDAKLVYAGRVGTGFTADSLRQLAKVLRQRRMAESPFDGLPSAAERRGVTWVKPELVAEVEFTEWTDEGLLRHPSFKGLREDKPARQITREEPVAMPRATHASKSGSAGASNGSARKGSFAAKSRAKTTVATSANGAVSVAGVALSNPGRVLYPEMGLTKQGLAEYYVAVAEWILPHVVGRPMTMVRCPDGRRGQCFYQKHLPHELPPGLAGVRIQEKSGTDEYVVVRNLAGIVSLVQMGVLELHPWPARADKLEAPDRLVIDLDPGDGAAWEAVVKAAREVRDRLGGLGLETFLRTSGGKGLHVVAPLGRRNTWGELKAFAKAIADDMVRRAPDKYTAALSKVNRRGKLFVDYLRNQRGSTAVASYSTRAREGAPVAAPIAWDELTTKLKPNGFTVANIPRRLARLKQDPWDGFFTARKSITRTMQAALEGED